MEAAGPSPTLTGVSPVIESGRVPCSADLDWKDKAGYLKAVWPDFWGCFFEVWPATVFGHFGTTFLWDAFDDAKTCGRRSKHIPAMLEYGKGFGTETS
jgi:hypothetical protein